MIEVARRSFLTGLIAFGVTAPAIVRATSIMPVRSIPMVFTESDLADLLGRLDDRANMWDGEYASRFGAPVMGPVDPLTRQVVRSNASIVMNPPTPITISEFGRSI